MAEMTCARWLGSPETGPAARRTVVLPGAAYPIDLPGLFLPSRALVLAGWEVWRMDWSVQPGTAEEAVAAVRRALDAFVAEHGAAQLVLAKSLGTFGASWAADHGVPAVWTTPLLRQRVIVDAVNQSQAPTLLIGGEEDPDWLPATVTTPQARVIGIPGANHGWQCGDWAREIDVYRDVTGAVVDFAASLPASPAR